MTPIAVTDLTDRDARALAAALNPLFGMPAQDVTADDRAFEARRSRRPRRRTRRIT